MRYDEGGNSSRNGDDAVFKQLYFRAENALQRGRGMEETGREAEVLLGCR